MTKTNIAIAADGLPVVKGEYLYPAFCTTPTARVIRAHDNYVETEDGEVYFADTLTHASNGFNPKPQAQAIWEYTNSGRIKAPKEERRRIATVFRDTLTQEKMVVHTGESTPEWMVDTLCDFQANYRNTGEFAKRTPA